MNFTLSSSREVRLVMWAMRARSTGSAILLLRRHSACTSSQPAMGSRSSLVKRSRFSSLVWLSTWMGENALFVHLDFWVAMVLGWEGCVRWALWLGMIALRALHVDHSGHFRRLAGRFVQLAPPPQRLVLELKRRKVSGTWSVSKDRFWPN